MKITAIRVQRLRLPLDPPFAAAWDPSPRRGFDASIVRVLTDEGVTGIGSGDTMDGFVPFEELFVGRDPLALAAHGRRLETISFHAGRYWPVEAALWDLAGRVLGVPVASMLGGSSRRIRAYASWGSLRLPAQRGDDALMLVEQGFGAVKVRLTRDRLAEGIATVAAIRDAVGDALEIMVDLNQWWRMPGDIEPGLGPIDARRAAERLREHGVLWVEEPLPAGDHWSNGIGLLANLHVCCGVGGGPFLEYPYDPPGWTPERRDFMLAAPVAVDPADGCLAVPDAPGLGIELDEDAVAHYAVGDS